MVSTGVGRNQTDAGGQKKKIGRVPKAMLQTNSFFFFTLLFFERR